MRRQFTRGDRVKQRLPRTIHRTESPEILVLLCNVIWASLISVDIYRGKYYWDKHLIRHSSASISDDIFAPQQCDGEATESYRKPSRSTNKQALPVRANSATLQRVTYRHRIKRKKQERDKTEPAQHSFWEIPWQTVRGQSK